MANNLRMSAEFLALYHAFLKQQKEIFNQTYVHPLNQEPAKPAIQTTLYAYTTGRPAAGAQSIKNSVGYGGPWRE